jgi:hypothetical protein
MTIFEDFVYKLNAMEHAATAKHPAAAGYPEARRAVLDFVADLSARVTLAEARIAKAREALG